MTVVEKLQDLLKYAGDKTSVLIEVTKLKNGISEEKKAIQAQYNKIGAICYEKYQLNEAVDTEIAELCAEVDLHQEAIREKEETIKAIAEELEAKKAARAAEAAEEESSEEEAPEYAECPDCHAVKPGTNNFCGICGAKLVVKKVRRCSVCGEELVEGKKFCPECGTKTE